MHLNSKLWLLMTAIIYSCFSNSAQCEGANILFLTPIICYSASNNFYKPVIEALAARNNTVTYWNGVKTDKTLTNNANLRVLYSEKVEKMLDSLIERNNNFDKR